MPSWITHFVTANRIKQDSEKNEFIFANIMPDILEGYNVKEVSKIVKNYQTHYPKEKIINGITIPLPNIEKFRKQYQSKMQNPVIKGYYCHLLTDYFWNTYTYENYFKSFDKEKDLVKLRLKNGKEKIATWDEAVKIKQQDFRNFTNYLGNNEKIVVPVYDNKIKKYSEELEEFEFTNEDIKNTAIFIKERIHEIGYQEEKEYQIFTRKELLEKLEESIAFIEQCFFKLSS